MSKIFGFLLSIIFGLGVFGPLYAQTAEGRSGPRPTFADIPYARSDATAGNGQLLDLYLPQNRGRPTPVIIVTGGSAWLADNGRLAAAGAALRLNRAGYAVAGVSIRSTGQIQFPGQLHDIKAAVRWLRSNAAQYKLDPDRIGIMGDSSGGWTSAMAAVTGDEPELEGSEGRRGVSSAVQAAVAFYPPTDFLQMDAWALAPCDPDAKGFVRFCHDGPTSPESRLVGCQIQTCPERVARANPMRYISPGDPPILIVHGGNDALVPHAQGELFYQALNKACHEATFISLPLAEHGVWRQMLSGGHQNYGATARSTFAAGCKVVPPAPVRFNWSYLIAFFDRVMR